MAARPASRSIAWLAPTAIFLAMGAATPNTAIAQPDHSPASRDDLDPFIESLDAPDLPTRDAATAVILSRGDISLAEIEAVLARPDLSAEQRTRLALIGREVFFRSPRPALGISFAQNAGRRAMIASTIEGFDAASALQPGDIVVEADGRAMPSRELFPATILSKAPGESLSIRVLRAGGPVDVQVELGSFESLPNAMSPAPETLARAWRIRSGLRSPAHPAPIVPRLEDQAGAPPDRGSRRWESIFASPDAPPELVVGGQPRLSIDESIWAMPLDEPAQAGPPGADLDALLAALGEQRLNTLAEITRLQSLLADITVPAAQRQAISARVGALQRRLVQLDEQIRALERAPARP